MNTDEHGGLGHEVGWTGFGISMMVGVCLCLLTGCVSPKPTNAVNANASAPGQKFKVDDNFQIEAAVYRYLLEKHPWGNGEYAAIFLEGDEARVAAFIRIFPEHVPPLKPSRKAQLDGNQAPVDKDTGRPGLLLSAKAVDPTNDVSEAIGNWNGGPAATGVSAFVLLKADGKWTIQSVQ